MTPPLKCIQLSALFPHRWEFIFVAGWIAKKKPSIFDIPRKADEEREFIATLPLFMEMPHANAVRQ